jgi:hypothetical protein
VKKFWDKQCHSPAHQLYHFEQGFLKIQFVDFKKYMSFREAHGQTAQKRQLFPFKNIRQTVIWI